MSFVSVKYIVNDITNIFNLFYETFFLFFKFINHGVSYVPYSSKGKPFAALPQGNPRQRRHPCDKDANTVDRGELSPPPLVLSGSRQTNGFVWEQQDNGLSICSRHKFPSVKHLYLTKRKRELTEPSNNLFYNNMICYLFINHNRHRKTNRQREHYTLFHTKTPTTIQVNIPTIKSSIIIYHLIK